MDGQKFAYVSPLRTPDLTNAELYEMPHPDGRSAGLLDGLL